MSVMHPPAQFTPDPPAPNLRDPAYRQLAANEALRVAELTAALTLVARYVPGPAGKIAGIAAIAFLGSPGENKKGNLGGAKTNPLPAPIGFAEPKVFGLKPNYYLPPGSTNYIPQPVDLIGLGLNDQRVADQSAEMRSRIALQAKRAQNLKGVSDQALANILQLRENVHTPLGYLPIPEFGTRTKDLKTAARNEQLFRAHPPLRQWVDATGFVPLDVLLAENFPVGSQPFGAINDGSTHPESLKPVNAKAIENEEKAEGIRRSLVSERADP